MAGAEAVLIEESGTPEKADAIILDQLRRDFADWMTANIKAKIAKAEQSRAVMPRAA